MQLPPALCAQADSSLFDRPHAALRAAVVCVVAKPNFDDHRRVLILHDQVKLAAAAPKVSVNQIQTPGQKKCQGQVFGLDAVLQVFCFAGLGVWFAWGFLDGLGFRGLLPGNCWFFGGGFAPSPRNARQFMNFGFG